MKSILFVSNYYYPYVSGVTEFERMSAEGMCKRGYEVKVIASRHDNCLQNEEIINGVTVQRCNVQMKIGKGTVSLPFLWAVIREAKKYDVVSLQLPMLEAGLCSLFIAKEKLMPMYHCDINLPKGVFNDFVVKVMDCSHKICLRRSNKIWVSTLDYASHSRITSKYADKLHEIGLPVKKMSGNDGSRQGDKPTIGFCGRIVEEKGLDVLIKAFKEIKRKIPHAKLLIGGDYENVAGGSVYPMLQEYIRKNHVEDVLFIGKIAEEKMGDFYASLDVFVLPSVNSLEAFGMVQAEAMMCGTPVVASDLYGVRTVVQKTGMGLTAKAGDVDSLADCIMEILRCRERYVKDAEYIENIYSTRAVLDRIEKLFKTKEC